VRVKAPPIPDEILARLATSRTQISPPPPGTVRGNVELTAWAHGTLKKTAWSLMLTDDRAILFDQDNIAVAQYGAREMFAQVIMPGFTTNARHVTFNIDDVQIGLYADKKNLALLKAYMTYSMASAGSEAVAEVKNTAVRDIIGGAIILAIGGAVTYFSYHAADEGDTYVLAYGAIFGGIIGILRGFAQLGSARSASRHVRVADAPISGSRSSGR
jgi:hypothetical protein